MKIICIKKKKKQILFFSITFSFFHTNIYTHNHKLKALHSIYHSLTTIHKKEVQNIKMFGLQRVVLFVLLLSCFYNIRSFAKLEDNSNVSDVQILIKSALPSDAPPVFFICFSGTFVLYPNKTHGWIVPNDRVDYCHAIWDHKEAYFNTFVPHYDRGHTRVYWLVQPNGFFHGWDNFVWVKRATWY